MPDYNAIATALAARYAPGLMSPPSGLGAVRVSTAVLPQTAAVTPAVYVFPESGEFEYATSTRQATSRFRLQFLYSQGLDMPRDTVALSKWAGTLADQLKGAAQLAGTVASARVAAWRAVKISYAGEDFNGVELDVDVITVEPWTATA